ncbi:hypothetical protein RRG08_007361 [Elysia crispata]|uniref:Transposase n=1 Tax=Elysia crispata TaxID=231223 RepID=A0AAE1E487_9GAST|nr:hypothetical protein RRG08_007361 [Elysia crispata]
MRLLFLKLALVCALYNVNNDHSRIDPELWDVQSCNAEFLLYLMQHLHSRASENTANQVNEAEEQLARINQLAHFWHRIQMVTASGHQEAGCDYQFQSLSKYHLLMKRHVSSVLVDDRNKLNSTRNFLRRFQTEQNDFLGRIITGDETWVYSWDPETKRQSAEWRDFDEPRPEKVRRKQGALKVMHMIFFDMNGVILRWPVPIGTTINAQYYKKVLQDKLRPAIRKKRPGLLESGILFHHDNAPVHTARAVTDVLAGYKWELLEHPRYSPDLAPCVTQSVTKRRPGDILRILCGCSRRTVNYGDALLLTSCQ